MHLPNHLWIAYRKWFGSKNWSLWYLINDVRHFFSFSLSVCFSNAVLHLFLRTASAGLSRSFEVKWSPNVTVAALIRLISEFYLWAEHGSVFCERCIIRQSKWCERKKRATEGRFGWVPSRCLFVFADDSPTCSPDAFRNRDALRIRKELALMERIELSDIQGILIRQMDIFRDDSASSGPPLIQAPKVSMRK